MKTVFSISTLILLSLQIQSQNFNSPLVGSWQGDKEVIIFTDDYYSQTKYDFETGEFFETSGGSWAIEDGKLNFMLEFNTSDPGKVGEEKNHLFSFDDNKLNISDKIYIRLDDGSPGKLSGAWLFAGRENDGQIRSRDISQARKTMKILSGMRFQWIAYNTETGEFFGTGGGTYTTIGTQYTETIKFFSRDMNKVGSVLNFDYEIKNNIWHHKGLNSSGQPMYELWQKR